jgi:hypothetical protein
MGLRILELQGWMVVVIGQEWKQQVQVTQLQGGLVPDPPCYPDGFCQVSASFLIGQYDPKYYAPNKYLSSDRMAIWCVYEWCSFKRSFTSPTPSCNPMHIDWIAVKFRWRLPIIQSDYTNIYWITNRTPGGEKVPATASFICRSYRDMIYTQILDWTESICDRTRWIPWLVGQGVFFMW